MAGPLDTIGKAVRHNMLCTVECECGNTRHYRAIEVGMAIGFGRHPEAVPFKCTTCKGEAKPPTIPWRLLDENRLPTHGYRGITPSVTVHAVPEFIRGISA